MLCAAMTDRTDRQDVQDRQQRQTGQAGRKDRSPTFLLGVSLYNWSQHNRHARTRGTHFRFEVRRTRRRAPSQQLPGHTPLPRAAQKHMRGLALEHPNIHRDQPNSHCSGVSSMGRDMNLYFADSIRINTGVF